MDAFSAALSQSINGYLGHQEEAKRLRSMLDAFSQATTLVVVQSPNGDIYSTGSNPELNLTDPQSLRGARSQLGGYLGTGIALRPYWKDEELQYCSIEQVRDLEVRIGGRLLRLQEATRARSQRIYDEDVSCYFIFDNFIPENVPQPKSSLTIDISFKLTAKKLAEVMRELREGEDYPEKESVLFNPARFTSDDVVGKAKVGGIRLDATYIEGDPPRYEGYRHNRY